MREFLERGFRIRLIGDLSALPEATRKVLLDAADESKNNTGLSLIIAINYGSRDEITRAVKSIAEKVKDGSLDPQAIDEDTITGALDTRDFPDVDLLIRTSGEQRISNYLLWQIAYAELEFVPESWPEFTPEVLARCLEEYSHRDRRFGGVTNE
jgi:undecaprenyl diphosphate synthase